MLISLSLSLSLSCVSDQSPLLLSLAAQFLEDLSGALIPLGSILWDLGVRNIRLQAEQDPVRITRNMFPIELGVDGIKSRCVHRWVCVVCVWISVCEYL
jgi:hypothetical protein